MSRSRQIVSYPLLTDIKNADKRMAHSQPTLHPYTESVTEVAAKPSEMPATWFTPQQYMQARQYYWQKLEKDKNLVFEDIPGEKKINYFNSTKQQVPKCQYDVMFHYEPGWDQNMWRSDRTHPKIIQEAIHYEEEERTVPVLTSSNYGHRKTPLEGKALFVHKRTQSTSEYYRVNGVNMDPTKGLPRDPNVYL